MLKELGVTTIHHKAFCLERIARRAEGVGLGMRWIKSKGKNVRIEELLSGTYSPAVTVHLDEVKDDDRNEIAGMLRGLMCAIEGWGIISGLTNDFFNDDAVTLKFSDVDNAHYFKSCVEYYFSEDILKKLTVKRRVYK